MLDQDVRAFAQVSCRVSQTAWQFSNRHDVEFGHDAVYLHGLSNGMLESCGLFDLAIKWYVSSSKNCLVFNGDPANEAQKRGWVGAEGYIHEFWRRDVDEDHLFATAPGIHTRSECDELVVFAKEHELQTVLIVTVLYHWPRVLACIVGSMEKYGYRFKVNFAAPLTVHWYQVMVGSQGTEKESTFLNETAGDVERFCTYLERGREDSGQAWKTRYGAPVEEIMKYLDWRDGITPD